jgi:hypothetical protein
MLALRIVVLAPAFDDNPRLAERLVATGKAHDVQRQILEAAARRPRDRDDLAERLRDDRF